MRRLIPVFCLLGCLAPASAWAGVEEPEFASDVSSEGGIVVSWRGDPAAGCAQQGVCDVAGSLTLSTDADQVAETGTSRSAYLILGRGIVRVTRGAGAAPAGACVDRLIEGEELSVIPGTRDGVSGDRPELEQTGFGMALSAGRCAGPIEGDFDGQDLLDPPRVTAGRLGGPLARIDFTGRRTAKAGPYAVTVDSTLVVTVRTTRLPASEEETSDSMHEADERARERRRRVRLVRRSVLDVTYAVEPPSGALVTTFRGVPGRGCDVFDACGLAGTVTVRPTERRRTALRMVAIGPARAGRSVRAALAAFGAGRMEVAGFDGGDAIVDGRLEAEVRRDGEAGVCRQSRLVLFPPVTLGVHAGRARLQIGSDDDAAGPEYDPWRTHCPGPVLAEPGVLAAATLPPDALLARTTTAQLQPRPFDTHPYAAVGGGDLRVTLRRIRASVRTIRMEAG